MILQIGGGVGFVESGAQPFDYSAGGIIREMAAGNSDEGKRGSIESAQQAASKQAIAEGRHQHRIGNLFLLNRLQKDSLVKVLLDEDSSAQIDQAHRRAPAGIEVQW